MTTRPNPEDYATQADYSAACRKFEGMTTSNKPAQPEAMGTPRTNALSESLRPQSWQTSYMRMRDFSRDLETELSQVTASRDQFKQALTTARALAYNAPELNMANYDHEQVRQLNDGMIDVFQVLDAALSQKEKT